MLKFPPFPTINKGISYTNSCISEYIGCKIFESVGIPVQELSLIHISVSGHSMMPTVHDGDRLLYNPFFKNVERGDVVVISHGGDMLIKRCLLYTSTQ